MSTSIQRDGTTTPEELPHLGKDPGTTNPSLIVPNSTQLIASDGNHVVPPAKILTKFETFRREQRKTSNRLNAKRWRIRRKAKLAELHDQMCQLRKDHAELELENRKLQKELAVEIQMAQAALRQKMCKPLRHTPHKSHLRETSNWRTTSPSNLHMTHCLPPMSSSTFTIPSTASHQSLLDGRANDRQVKRLDLSSRFSLLLSRELPPALTVTYPVPTVTMIHSGGELAKYSLTDIMRAATTPCFTVLR